MFGGYHLFRECILCAFVKFIELILRVITNNYVQISKICPYRISTKFGMRLDVPRTGVALDGRQKWTTNSL